MEKIIELAQAFCSDESVELDEDTSIVVDMELSSMEFFKFVSEVEKEFDVRISERMLNRIDTLGDLFEVVGKGK